MLDLWCKLNIRWYASFLIEFQEQYRVIKRWQSAAQSTAERVRLFTDYLSNSYLPIANECKCTYWITNEDAQNWSMAVLHVQHLMAEDAENSITLKSTPQMRFSRHLRNVRKPAWKMVQWENIFPRRQVVKVWFCWFRIIRAMHNKVSLARLPAAWIWNHFKIWQYLSNSVFIHWKI